MPLKYQLQYDFNGTARRISSYQHFFQLLGWVVAAVFLLALLIWSSGGNGEVTRQALENMAASIEQGEGLKEAFSSFCMEILQGA